jgi:site-specific recombinase XerD
LKGTVILRGKTWSYTVDIGKDPLKGKRKQKSTGGFARKKDAEAALRKVLILLDENDLNISSSETFSSFIELWFHSHYKKRIKETTVSSREYLMERHLIRDNPFSHKNLSEITVEDIDAFYNLKLEGNFSTSYIRKMHQMLYQAFSQAVKWKKVNSNPVQDADPPGVKKEEMVIWSFEEIHRFLQHCKEKDSILRFFLLYTPV